jgi:hypothetical protein
VVKGDEASDVHGYEKSSYRREFVKEYYPELLEVYDNTENMILLLKEK